MSVRITYFVHGETTDNAVGRATGWEPGELSALGVQQSRELGQLTTNQRFDAVIASDLKRAIDSAELAFAARYSIVRDARLREANYGQFNGWNVGFKQALTDHIDIPFPGGESYRDVERRIRSLLHDLWQQHQGHRVALVAHQAPQLALEVVLKGKSWSEAIASDWRHTKTWQPGWTYELVADPQHLS